MSVQDTQQIDKVLYNETTKEIILLMVEDRDAYSSDKQLLQLQEKFNTYTRYATEGLLAEHFPASEPGANELPNQPILL